ncbi:hypothetical protein HMPREF3228_00471 [Streptococcus mitis]|uniref:Uncharacterized protein n=1 Tax=Streptococcus mitis TaxID=28037 RepID=A0A133S161_STRMT|nr:hypothetical protein HMPREF3228_00471 [Streptococcus mitis]
MAGRALEMEKDVIKTRERAKILARSKNCFMKSLSIFSLNLLFFDSYQKKQEKKKSHLYIDSFLNSKMNPLCLRMTFS